MNQSSYRILFILFIIALTGCSRSVDFKKSPIVPAANVDLSIEQDNNNNYKLDLKVSNLAQPSELTPAKKYYVVWTESKQGTFNVGRLEVNSKLKGRLQTLSPYKPSRVYVTAEDDFNLLTSNSKFILVSEETGL